MGNLYTKDVESLQKFFREKSPKKFLIGGGVTTYILEEPSGKEHVYTDDVCHARANPQSTGGKAIAVHTSIVNRTPENKFYRDWLLSKEVSPWRSILQDAQFIPDPMTGEIMAVSIVDLPSKSTAMVMNFLFATRVHSEFAKESRYLFLEAGHKAGLPLPTAFYLAHILSGTPKVTKLYPYANNWHSPVNYTRQAAFGLRGFAAGEPANTKVHRVLWKEPMPIGAGFNTVWNTSQLVDGLSIISSTLDGALNLPVYNGKFSSLFSRSYQELGIKDVLPLSDKLEVDKLFTFATIIAAYPKWRDKINV